MTDTRPHFYYNSYYVTGENLDPSFIYWLLIYINGSGWIVANYIEYSDPTRLGGENLKIYSIPQVDIDDLDDIYGLTEEELVVNFPRAKYIGLLEYPNGELYEQEDDSSWEIAGKTVKSLHIGNKEIQSIKRISDGIILYYKTSSIIPDDINITATKDVLSYYHGESSVLTATVVDANNQPCSGETVVFKIGNIVLSTQTTDSNGEVSYTYQSAGVGDVSIKVECRSLEKTYVIYDLFYANLTEHTNDGWGTIDSGIPNLPSSFEMTVDLYTTGVVQNNEQRLYLCPSSTFNGGSQPTQGIYVGFNRPNNVEYGYRNGSTSWSIYQISNMDNNWNTFKVVRNGNSYSYYINGTLMDTKTYANMSNYNSFTFCWMNWASSYTFKFKNLKIKTL